jgi:hypothetical protein
MTVQENVKPIRITLEMDEKSALDVAAKVQDTFVKSKYFVMQFSGESTVGGTIVEFLHNINSRYLDIYLKHHIIHISY